MTPSSILARAAAVGVALVCALGAVSAQAQQAVAASTDADLRKLFDAADANRDGFLDVDEAVADAIRAFGAYDKNRDRFLSFDELPRHNPDRVRRADRNGDGKLSIGEVASDRVWEFFEVDANGDGALSFDEVRQYVQKSRAATR